MKKYILTAAVMLGLLATVKAGPPFLDTPRGHPQALATADYGGVQIASSVFSTAMSTGCNNCSGVFYGVLFSTGNFANNDFVEIFDAPTAASATANNSVLARIHNFSLPSSTITAGFKEAGWPVRFKSGIQFRPSSAGYNFIGILFQKNDDEQ